MRSQVNEPAIAFDRVTKQYGDAKRVVDDVSLEIARGNLAVVVGPSGCGKTTLLKTVNRLIEPTSGQVFVNGVNAQSLEPTALRRSIGYVIQQIGLFPHMTVAENVAVVPALLGWSRDKIGARVADMLDLVRLPAAEYGKRFPAALSGGQQQRVGIARALAADPAILLMDEPFGALDAIERARLQTELARLHQSLRKTILFVTHDVDEALRLADIMVVMRDGRVVQADRPLIVLSRPADRFVAELVNADDMVRRFGVMRVRDVPLGASDDGQPSHRATVRLDDSLRVALSAMLSADELQLGVLDESGRPAGTLTLEHMLVAARAPR